MNTFFVTGTDTDVGKTYATCVLLKKLKQAGMSTLAMKPVAAGCEETDDGTWCNDDALALQSAMTAELPYRDLNPFALRCAIAPHIAAKESGCVIDSDLVVRRYSEIERKVDRAVVEGAGGWRVPLNWPEVDSSECETIASLAKKLNFETFNMFLLFLSIIKRFTYYSDIKFD